MGMKKYKAYSDLFLNVTYDGRPRHIQFDSLSTGNGSVYLTDDAKMQKAIEEHPFFERYIDVEEVRQAAPSSSPGDRPGVRKAVEIQVSGPDDAKDYIADTFGISRSQLRSVEAIRKAAAENNIVFKGL